MSTCTCNQREWHIGKLKFTEDGYEHIVSFSSGFTCERWLANKKDPQNHGIGCVDILFLVRNERGAIQFRLLSGWYPNWHEKTYGHGDTPLPSDLGYHALEPQYEGQTMMTEHCPWLNDRPCYYDGSTLNAKEPFNILVNQGESALWKFLRDYHREIFEPVATESEKASEGIA